MDTARLQTLLQQASFLDDDASLDVDLIQHIMAILDVREPVVVDPVPSLKIFKGRIISLADIGEEQANRPHVVPVQVASKKKRLTQRFALVAAAVIVMLFVGSTLVASAFGVHLWDYVIHWGKETFQIGPGANNSTITANEMSPTGQQSASIVKQQKFETMSDALQAFDSPIDAPKWLPDGFVFYTAEKLPGDQRKSLTAVYKADGKTLMFNACIYTTEEAAYSYEINESSGESITIAGNTYYLMSNMDQNRIVWVKGNTVYSINGDVEKEDLIKMVGSIYTGETYEDK